MAVMWRKERRRERERERERENNADYYFSDYPSALILYSLSEWALSYNSGGCER